MNKRKSGEDKGKVMRQAVRARAEVIGSGMESVWCKCCANIYTKAVTRSILGPIVADDEKTRGAKGKKAMDLKRHIRTSLAYACLSPRAGIIPKKGKLPHYPSMRVLSKATKKDCRDGFVVTLKAPKNSARSYKHYVVIRVDQRDKNNLYRKMLIRARKFLGQKHYGKLPKFVKKAIEQGIDRWLVAHDDIKRVIYQVTTVYTNGPEPKTGSFNQRDMVTHMYEEDGTPHKYPFVDKYDYAGRHADANLVRKLHAIHNPTDKENEEMRKPVGEETTTTVKSQAEKDAEKGMADLRTQENMTAMITFYKNRPFVIQELQKPSVFSMLWRYSYDSYLREHYTDDEDKTQTLDKYRFSRFVSEILSVIVRLFLEKDSKADPFFVTVIPSVYDDRRDLEKYRGKCVDWLDHIFEQIEEYKAVENRLHPKRLICAPAAKLYKSVLKYVFSNKMHIMADHPHKDKPVLEMPEFTHIPVRMILQDYTPPKPKSADVAEEAEEATVITPPEKMTQMEFGFVDELNAQAAADPEPLVGRLHSLRTKLKAEAKELQKKIDKIDGTIYSIDMMRNTMEQTLEEAKGLLNDSAATEDDTTD